MTCICPIREWHEDKDHFGWQARSTIDDDDEDEDDDEDDCSDTDECEERGWRMEVSKVA
jgi:hypothetical protein